jgi:hypothetical protein
MDDPTRRCENDTGIETRLPGLPVPSGSPSFFLSQFPNKSSKEAIAACDEQLVPSVIRVVLSR